MVTQETIDRINALARKSKTAEGLTDAEKEEQARLRQEYVAAYRESLRATLEHTTILRPDGTVQKVSDLKKRKN